MIAGRAKYTRTRAKVRGSQPAAYFPKFRQEMSIADRRGVPTLRIFVSGEPQNLFVNLKILPGIGSLKKLFGKLQIILEYYIIYLGLASNFVLFSGDVSFCLSMVNCKL